MMEKLDFWSLDILDVLEMFLAAKYVFLMNLNVSMMRTGPMWFQCIYCIIAQFEYFHEISVSFSIFEQPLQSIAPTKK